MIRQHETAGVRQQPAHAFNVGSNSLPAIQHQAKKTVYGIGVPERRITAEIIHEGRDIEPKHHRSHAQEVFLIGEGIVAKQRLRLVESLPREVSDRDPLIKRIVDIDVGN